MTLLISTDNGRLYLEREVDDPDDRGRWQKIEVPGTVTLTAEQLTNGDSVAECLLRAGVARLA